MRYLIFLLLCSFSVAAFAEGNKDEAQIRQILKAQVVAWNSGNIEGFMHGYWENDSLVFIGKTGPTYGYNATLLRYKKAYPNAVAMGTLTSTIISIKKLSAQFYFIVGKWHLARKSGDLSGSYTLLFQKINGVWVIINDHSS